MHYITPEVYKFISKQTNDPIIERKTCRISGTKFAIFQSDLDFYKKISPKFGDKLYLIPTPTLCPEERQRRRLMFRNERKLYRRKCDASEKSIVSIYSPDKPYKVYDQKIRRSDNWDAMDYGKTFDFNKTFTEQFDSLLHTVPRMWVNVIDNENCTYVSYAWYNKNCHLIYTSDQNESCFHGSYAINNHNCIDFIFLYDSKECFDCNHCEKCFGCSNSLNLDNCSHCQYSQNLKWCSHCYRCSDLQNKQYCIENKQYTKEEYKNYIEHRKCNMGCPLNIGFV